MIVGKDQWDEREENRTIQQISTLIDISAVTLPASPTTSIQVAESDEAFRARCEARLVELRRQMARPEQERRRREAHLLGLRAEAAYARLGR